METVQFRSSHTINMNTIIFATLLALATARPDKSTEDVAHVISSARSDPTADGAFSSHFETSNGIRSSQSGSGSGASAEAQGTVAFTLPNGEAFELTFVANDGRYQPISDHLPVAPVETRVAPEALHPVPQHALDQIEQAAREDAAGIFYDQSGFVIE